MSITLSSGLGQILLPQKTYLYSLKPAPTGIFPGSLDQLTTLSLQPVTQTVQ
jgi:hypothetical protein